MEVRITHTNTIGKGIPKDQRENPHHLTDLLLVDSASSYDLPDGHVRLFKNNFSKIFEQNEYLRKNRYFLLAEVLNMLLHEENLKEVYAEVISTLKNICKLTKEDIKKLVNELGFVTESRVGYRSEDFIVKPFEEMLERIFSNN